MTKNSNQGGGPALTFLLIAIDTNGFRRMNAEEGLIYKTLPQIF